MRVRRLPRPHLVVRRPPRPALARRRGELRGGGRPAVRTPPHQGPPRLPHRTTTRRPMAHLPPRRHRDPHAGTVTRHRLKPVRRYSPSGRGRTNRSTRALNLAGPMTAPLRRVPWKPPETRRADRAAACADTVSRVQLTVVDHP